ncbi:FHA domain-containing protein [Pseudonocardia kunmingensis]|uniref:FHA domain-containing protein n=1 Tax=Pseudonocardia kunmingensis TaxID=630975 RepID=A0A543DYN0_9PSEU|nr:FHA domain-containing protein [Pseudonocardia kunmingensis]TQM14424.1 FHA domain-containing protein [Pseudonocardia kunmingensis]
MDFDALRAAVVPGAAVVGRWPGVICVAECADRHVLRQLLDVCASASGGEPGRTLARRLAGWLGGSDAPGDGLRFGTVAVTGGDSRARGEQWAVFLYGSVGLVVPDRQVALSGAQSVAWTDRLLPRPDAPVVLALEGGPIPPGVVDGVHDLRAGVVPAAGAVLVPGGEDRSAGAADESVRNRPDEPRWPDAGPPERPRWVPEPSTAPAEGLYPGDTPGNGMTTRTSFDAIDGGFGRYEGGGPERTNGNGRAHLRPVPSNGVAHRDWAPRRGSLDVDRDQDAAEQRRSGGPAEDEPAEAAPPRSDRPEGRRLPPDRDDPRGPETTSPGIGDDPGAEHGSDRAGSDRALDDRPLDDRPRNGLTGLNGLNGLNGHRTNGAAYNLLGGTPEQGPRESEREAERSPWSDGPDLGRPDRIEGWFATRDDSGTEADLSAIGPTELRRRRHGRPEDDAAHEHEPAAETAHEGTDPEQGEREFGGYGDQGEFGAGSAEYDSAEPVADDADRSAVPDGADLDGSGDGTPRLGVPRAEEAGPEQDPHATLTDVEAPHTTALRSERILGVAPGEAERPALDDGPVTGGLAVDARQDEQQVHGYLCARGHLNDPRAQFCGLCGVPMEEQSGPPTLGARPPLGLLVFDDGATYTVDAEYLMGRMPEADDRVTSGSLRPLALEDTSGAVSRVHAQIVVDGWDALIVDAGSRNGTFVSPPGEQVWTQLPAGETHRLVPGTRVRIGGRSFQFETPVGGH